MNETPDTSETRAEPKPATPSRLRWRWLFAPLLLGLCAYVLWPTRPIVTSGAAAPKAPGAGLPVIAVTARKG